MILKKQEKFKDLENIFKDLEWLVTLNYFQTS